MQKYYNKKEDDIKVNFSQRILGRVIFCSSLKDAVNIAKSLIALSRTNEKNDEVSLQYLEESINEFQEFDGLIEHSDEGYLKFKEMEKL